MRKFNITSVQSGTAAAEALAVNQEVEIDFVPSSITITFDATSSQVQGQIHYHATDKLVIGQLTGSEDYLFVAHITTPESGSDRILGFMGKRNSSDSNNVGEELGDPGTWEAEEVLEPSPKP